jgi:hypothetical protein
MLENEQNNYCLVRGGSSRGCPTCGVLTSTTWNFLKKGDYLGVYEHVHMRTLSFFAESIVKLAEAKHGVVV